MPLPLRSATWQLRTRSLTLGRRPLLMGIVNVTPDSFSDGGRYLGSEAAIEHGLRLVAEGADILDIGGESTRPYSESVSASEELRRVKKVVEALCRQSDVPVSIDTSKGVVAEAALEAGAEIINDITGLESDPSMIEVAVRFKAAVCAMHMQGTPRTMQDNPTYEDVVTEIGEYLKQRRDALVEAGIDLTRICLDPGIGFGKRHEHNLTLLANCEKFHLLGVPLLVGPSRKGFIGKVLDNVDCDRTASTIGVALSLAAQGVQVLRVHDIAPIREALLLFEATGGLGSAGQQKATDKARKQGQSPSDSEE